MVLVAMILALCAGTFADNCNPETLFELDGNEYCTAIQAIRYDNVGTPGTYSQIVEMSPTGQCSSVPKTFSGPLSPLDEEVGTHLNERSSKI
jgi:hypothetical protein